MSTATRPGVSRQPFFNLVWFSLFVLSIGINILTLWFVPDRGGDWDIFIASGRLALLGQNPYAVANLTPPFFLPLFEWFSTLPAPLTLWTLLSVLTYAACLLVLYQEERDKRVFLCMACAGLWQTLYLGQIYALLLALVMALYVGLKHRNHRLAAVALGLLIAVKPNLALVLIFLCCASHYRLALSALLVCLATYAVSLVAFGFTIYTHWLHLLLTAQPLGNANNLSLPNLLLGFPPLELVLIPACLIAGLAWAYVDKPTPGDVLAVGLWLALWLSPLMWLGYAILLIPFSYRTAPRAALALFAVPPYLAYAVWGLGLLYPLAWLLISPARAVLAGLLPYSRRAARPLARSVRFAGSRFRP